MRSYAVAVSLCVGVASSCVAPMFVEIEDETQLVVMGRGAGRFDVDSGAVTWQLVDATGALLDASDVLPLGQPENCAPASWNPATLVLSVDARVRNGSTSSTYLSPIELRLTGIEELGVVRSVNTDLVHAGCGRNGLSIAADDLSPKNGAFDCIYPDDPSNTADDPGWDFSSAIGSDGALGHGETSSCRLIYFNLVSQTDFTFYFDLLGVIDDAWPPAPVIDPVTTPTPSSTITVAGRCVTTVTPPPAPPPSTNVVKVEGGAAISSTPCQTASDCRSVGGIDYCGSYSASVSLNQNTTNNLSVYQMLDGVDRSGASVVSVVHDSAAPQLSSINPASGATGVSPSANVIVTFSEAMDAASITSSNPATANIFLTLLGSTTRIAATVSLGTGGTQVVLDPTATLDSETSYQVTVTTGVRDLAGNALGSQGTSSFRTARSTADTTPPQVATIAPPNGASGVDRRTTITITFSEAISNRPSTDPSSPSCLDSSSVTCTAIVLTDIDRGRNVPATRILSTDATAVTVSVRDATYDSTGPDPISGGGCVTQPSTPALDLDCQTHYRLQVSTAITDLAGNALAAAFVSNLQTGTTADTLPPIVSAFLPATGAVGVSEGIRPNVLFNEPVAAATVNGSTLQLKLDGLTTVAASVSLSGDGITATIVPTQALLLGTRYLVFVGSSITDLAGNSLGAPRNSDFTVRGQADGNGPLVAAVTPPNEAENIRNDVVLTIEFNEPVAPTTVSTANIILDEMRIFDPTKVAQNVSGQVSLSADGLVATFAPLSNLRSYRVHRLTVTTGVSDLVNNFMEASFVSTFRTELVDQQAPCVVAVSPEDGSGGLATSVNFALSFSETMDPTTVLVDAFDLSAGSTPLAKSVTLSADNTQVLIVPDAPLPNGAAITLTAYNTLADNSTQGNRLDQGSTAANCLNPSGPAEPTFSFTTGAGTDTIAPEVVAIAPADGLIGVSLAANVDITFSEPVDPLTVGPSSILLSDPSGNRVALVHSLGSDGTVVTMDPVDLLADLKVYTVTVPATVRDLSGNLLGQTVTTHFTTLDGSLDVAPPHVVSVCPADNATTVNRQLMLGCNTQYPGKVVVVFDEPLNSDTVNTGTFHLAEYILNVLKNNVTSSVTLEPDGRTVLITPIFTTGGGLKNATYHRITISPTVTDEAGNPLVVQDLCGSGSGNYCVDFNT